LNELQVVKRKIKLARQGLVLTRVEIDELEFKYTLLKAKARLEQQINGGFDPVLSRKLDCVIFLLEN
jgi:hypothetical protein